jgi:hypothetical protein
MRGSKTESATPGTVPRPVRARQWPYGISPAEVQVAETARRAGTAEWMITRLSHPDPYFPVGDPLCERPQFG